MQILSPEFEHTDERRTITQLLTKDLKQVNHYKAKKGAILGDHYHKETIEYFMILSGVILYNGNTLHTSNDFFVVYPEENHTIECLTDVEMLTFLTKPYTKDNPDIWRGDK